MSAYRHIGVNSVEMGGGVRTSPTYYLGIYPLGNPPVFNFCSLLYGHYRPEWLFRLNNASQSFGWRDCPGPAGRTFRLCPPDVTDTLTLLAYSDVCGFYIWCGRRGHL